MTKISISTLVSLFTIGELSFSYTTKDGELKTTRGKEGTLDIKGNVVYFDLNENGYRTVHANSNIEALLNKYDPNWQVPKKGYVNQTVSVNPSQLKPGTSIATTTLQDLLATTIVKFEYTKGDGTLRLAYGTTDTKRLPSNLFINQNNSSVVNYFDIEKKAIRSVSRGVYVKLIDTFDLPLKK
jgi:hypothetical protein